MVTGAVLALAGCSGAPGGSAGQDGPMSADDQRTLDSLKLLDDHPLYEMAWSGPVPKVKERAPGEDAAAAPEGGGTAGRSPYACTVFVAAGQGAAPVVGRNFDWDPNPALVLTTDPPDGYATVSVVDISYLGLDAGAVGDGGSALMTDPEKRRELLDAPRLPFDGMNEHGVVVAMAADETGRAELVDDRPTVGSVGVMRQVLESSRTVAEAVAALRRVNIDFDGGPALHYIVADAAGASAVVEFVDGVTKVMPAVEPWQVLVNFTLATSTPAIQQGDRRYRTASDALHRAGGRLTPPEALSLLDRVQQGHTQWSVVYEPRTGTATIATGRRFDRTHVVRVPR